MKMPPQVAFGEGFFGNMRPAKADVTIHPVDISTGMPIVSEKKSGKWIQQMHMKKGALHKQLGVPQGEKIPAKKLEAASKKGGTLGKRANLAKTLNKLNKNK